MTEGFRGRDLAAAPWEQEQPADELGSFEWNAADDVWTWSDQMYALHGYRPGEVEPDVDLVVSHKLPEDRHRAERILAHGGTPGFRFHNLHGIVDAHGSERLVLSVGAAVLRHGRQVMSGSMVDVTGVRREWLRRLTRIPERAPLERLGPDPQAELSGRERQVLALIAAGRSNEEIARELFVSVNTVKTYVRAAYRKIGVQRRSQAILWWLDR